MSVRYVLSAVLPRYTMTGSRRASFAAGALGAETYPPQPVAPKLCVVRPAPDRDDADVMVDTPWGRVRKHGYTYDILDDGTVLLKDGTRLRPRG